MRHLAVCFALLLAACPSRGTGTANPTGARTSHELTHTWIVKPGKFAEANLHMGANAQVHAEFTSSDLVQWNVHSHAGKEEKIHEQGEGTAGTIDFSAPAEGSYSLLWTNDNSESVKIEVTITGGARLEGWEPPQ